ncbi:hypothetical protein LCM4577_22430 [Mesorhizobium sp. LCM 4577]|uniref:hypothetical protein n=1 Tax=unclassified Mesorhizobium TaxID=325217 RepID=UPI0008DA81B4|nr:MULTISPECIES: hypothetical protein [unclassified Mesorhizobium]OHV69354.1 hypothetical protein LCM4577_22430 [Mesorhizobium sp. LCM 4577]OHV73750.1 hypothetical protein LCM4576_15870 [Mesorhizobium sp. LCM 4576]
MSPWKWLQVVAVVPVSIIGSNVMPTMFGGGHRHHQPMAMPPRTLTTADIDAEIRKQNLGIFEAIAREFPDDYDAMLRKITAAAQAGNQTEVRNISRQAVADLRHRYAPLLPTAPDSNAWEVLSAQLDMLNHVMARETPATCNNYLRNGPDAISAPGHDFLADMDRIGAALFRAYGAAKRSGLPTVAPSDQDWSLVADIFKKIGGTPAEMEAVSNANPDFPGLCPAMAKFYEAALSLQGEPGWHIKTSLLRTIVKN